MLGLQQWLRPEQAAVGGRLPDVVGAALPLFFFLIAVEALAAWRAGRRVYTLRQTTNNLAAGILSVLLGIFAKALHIWPFVALHARLGLLRAWPQGPHAWALHGAALLVADAGFYWQHRFMHATNLGWAAHVVHHSSPDFNLSTALRQGAGESTFSFLFFLPLALFCTPEAYALHRGINTTYQFFTHTELVGRCWAPVELIMNTPSHHRVHHARNYGRRNFAGVLIIWDRLFGTFEAEEPDARPCVYGLDAQPVPLGTLNPLWHQAHHAAATLSLAASGKVPVWRALLTRQPGPGMVLPSVTDAERGGQRQGRGSATAAAGTGAAEDAGEGRTAGAGAGPAWEQRRPLGSLEWYAVGHFFLLTLPGSFVYLLAAPHLSPGALIVGAAFAAWTTITTGWLCGRTAAAAGHELARLLAQPALALGAAQWGLLPQPWGDWLARLAIASSAACIVFLVRHLPDGSPTGRLAAGGCSSSPAAAEAAAAKEE